MTPTHFSRDTHVPLTGQFCAAHPPPTGQSRPVHAQPTLRAHTSHASCPCCPLVTTCYACAKHASRRHTCTHLPYVRKCACTHTSAHTVATHALLTHHVHAKHAPLTRNACPSTGCPLATRTPPTQHSRAMHVATMCRASTNNVLPMLHSVAAHVLHRGQAHA